MSIPKSGKKSSQSLRRAEYLTQSVKALRSTPEGSPCLLDLLLCTYKRTLLLFQSVGSSDFLDASCQGLKVSSSNPEKKTAMSGGVESKVELRVAISLKRLDDQFSEVFLLIFLECTVR